jgi:Tol biopolymer transport system component
MSLRISALVLFTLLAVQPAPSRSGDPLVSPDGSRIAFTSNRDGTPDLYVVPVDGSGVLRLTRTPEEETLAGWSADGRRLWFARTANDSSRVFSIDRDGTHQAEVVTLPSRSVRLSPDGSRVLYWRGTAHRVQPADPGPARPDRTRRRDGFHGPHRRSIKSTAAPRFY